jgi:Uma2 family endonuclease
MNVSFNHAAEDLPPRRAFTAEDIGRMVATGVLGEDERVELIEGDLVVMAAKGIAHERVKNALNMAIVRVAPDELVVGVENTLQLDDDVLVEPDIAVVARPVYKASTTGFARPGPEDVFLVIEIAVSSLAYDRNLKSHLYARHGVREFWVVDANERVVWIHTGPSDEGWSSITEHGANESLTTPVLPGLAIKLSEID